MTMPASKARVIPKALRLQTSIGSTPAIPAQIMVAPAIGDIVRPQGSTQGSHGTHINSLQSKLCRMRSNSFVKSYSCSIAGTGDHCQNKRAKGCSDLNDAGRFKHPVDQGFDQPQRLHSGNENANRNDDTNNIGISIPPCHQRKISSAW